ncbi:MAG: hypothetical protein WC593_04450 [Methanoregula sp.]
MVEVIESTLKSEIKKGTLQVAISLFDRWEVASLDYKDTGFHLSMRGTQIKKPFTINTSIKIAEIVHKSPEYCNLIEFLKTNTHIEENPVNLVNYFIIQTIEKYFENTARFFENPNFFKSETDRFVEALVADLKNESNKTRMIVEFYGIILHEDEIKLSPEIILRKPIPEDFNTETISYTFFNQTDFPEPTAFLDISLQAKCRQDLYNEITKTIAVLQLFRPMSINWHIYQIHSESFNPCFERKDPPIEKHLVFENYILEKEEVDDLKDFWKMVYPILPQNLNSSEENNFTFISNAYRFYSDSISQNGMFERKIASAVIGLDSIFLKTINEDKKSKQLTLRISKLLKNENFAPTTIKDVIGDAYFCRSKYLHGELLSNNDKERIAKKYGGNVNNLLKTILEFLRISIVILFHFQSGNKEKFLDMIDMFLKDENGSQRLIEFLKHVNVVSMRDKKIS